MGSISDDIVYKCVVRKLERVKRWSVFAKIVNGYLVLATQLDNEHRIHTLYTLILQGNTI